MTFNNKIIYYLILIILLMSILCYLVNIEGFTETLDLKKSSRIAKKRIRTTKKRIRSAKKPIIPAKKLITSAKKPITPAKKLITPAKKTISRAKKTITPVNPPIVITPQIRNTIFLPYSNPPLLPPEKSKSVRHMTVPKVQLVLSLDSTFYLFNNDGNIIKPIDKLKCWKGEQIANIVDRGDYYEYDCYNINADNNPSKWECRAGNNWNDASFPVRKSSNGEIECAGDNQYTCINFDNPTKCKEFMAQQTSILPSALQCGNDHNNKYGSTGYNDKYHWCTRKYNELTNSGL